MYLNESNNNGQQKSDSKLEVSLFVNKVLLCSSRLISMQMGSHRMQFKSPVCLIEMLKVTLCIWTGHKGCNKTAVFHALGIGPGSFHSIVNSCKVCTTNHNENIESDLESLLGVT